MADALFRLTAPLRHDPAIDAWLDAQEPELGTQARLWFTRMRSCGTDVRELMHDGCPVACVADAAFGYVNVFAAHLNVGFFRGALLDDPGDLLEGSGKRMRHVKLQRGVAPDHEALARLIEDACADIRRSLAAAGDH